MPEEVSADNHGMGQFIISKREAGNPPTNPALKSGMYNWGCN